MIVELFSQMVNPLDYFLNAKPFIDPNRPREVSRSPSPTGRSSPYRKHSNSPPRRAQRRSLSPEMNDRRRSLSADRFEGARRRSGSVGRSGSPDWRDRKFTRRSRSPPRRRSRYINHWYSLLPVVIAVGSFVFHFDCRAF